MPEAGDLRRAGPDRTLAPSDLSCQRPGCAAMINPVEGGSPHSRQHDSLRNPREWHSPKQVTH